ncbi:MAG: MoaD/ThiS family protein [Deltaproteobacteria bacterium]|nr:MoaD/ThiS family protein [Deltaproteobacteria bacterium]
MKITVRLFATLSRHLPPGAVRNCAGLDVREGATVAEVMNGLGLDDKFPRLAFVNNRREKDAARSLKDGDDLAVFPPIGGG